MGTFFKEVVPLREASKGVVTGEIACWNEDVMRGQLYTSLLACSAQILFGGPSGEKITAETLAVEREGDVYWNWQVPYFATMAEGRRIKTSDKTSASRPDAARFYADIYGMNGWEAKWSSYEI